MKAFLTAALVVMASAGHADVAVPAGVPLRFQAEVEAFAAVARPDASTLFVGSSSIRLWDVAHSFPKVAAVNRGFGGATTPDVLRYYDRVIAGVPASTVIVYVGENDIADGATAEQTAADVLTLLARLRADMPRARIAYLSMKPTPSRWDLYPRISAANAAIQTHAGEGAFDYLDVGHALMTVNGAPDAQFYRADGLHLNDQGYQRWTAIIDRYLQPAGQMAAATVKTAS